MADGKPEVEKTGEGWVVRLTVADGRVQTYHCATEQIARKLALSLTAGIAGKK